MAKRYIDKKTGQSLQFPPTREEARSARFKRYNDGTICPVCNTQSSRYASTNYCHRCQVRKSTALHAMVYADHLWDHINLTCQIEYGVPPVKFDDDTYMELLEMKWKMDDDKSLIPRSQPCVDHGHVHMSSNGKCYWCKERAAPRRKAVLNGDKWYKPVDPCIHCGTRSLKRVNNGQCQGCTPPSTGESPRDEATREGEKTYAGRACSTCYTDVRITRTGKCERCANA